MGFKIFKLLKKYMFYVFQKCRQYEDKIVIENPR